MLMLMPTLPTTIRVEEAEAEAEEKAEAAEEEEEAEAEAETTLKARINAHPFKASVIQPMLPVYEQKVTSREIATNSSNQEMLQEPAPTRILTMMPMKTLNLHQSVILHPQ